MTKKWLLEEAGKMAENLKEFFAFVFTLESMEHISTLELLFLQGISEELSQIEVTR